MTVSVANGGCLCGDVRYEVDPAGAFDAGYCHCSMCRRSTGAPVVAWALVRAASFRLLAGAPVRYRSSAILDRLRCPRCGSQLFYEVLDQPGFWGLHVATLDGDTPAALRPRLHMCVADRLRWFDVGDALPRFATNQLSDPAGRGGTPGIDQADVRADAVENGPGDPEPG